MNNNKAVFSRAGNSNPLGKRTEDVRGKVPHDIKLKMLHDIADGISGSESELVCDILMLHYYGSEGLLRIREEQLNRMLKKGQERGGD